MKKIICSIMTFIIFMSAFSAVQTTVYATDAQSVINSAELYPCKTGIIELDNEVARIINELKPGCSDTYSLVKAIYTYIITTTDYGYSKESVAKTITFHKDPLYETAIPDFVSNYAIETIFDHQGICNNYNSAMIVFARAIGLEAYYFGGETHAAAGGYTPHAWCEIKINDVFYVFDPNVDYSIYTSNGSIMYLYFCKTEEEMSEKYIYGPDYLSYFGEVKPESERITPVEYLYDEEVNIPGFDDLPLSDIEDEKTAVSYAKKAVNKVSYDNVEGMDYALVYCEEAYARAASVETDDETIVIDNDLIKEAVEVADSIEKDSSSYYNNSTRSLKKKVRIVSNSGSSVSVEKKKITSDVDSVVVVTPYVSVEFDASDVKNVSLSSSGTNKVSVSFDKADTTTTTKVKVSFPNITSDNYKAVVDENGDPVGGKYNSVTDEITAKIDESGIYTVVTNEKDFTDIKDKAAEMQEAIKLLASKGIINGTSAQEFSPDQSISRAEVAAIILRTLSSLDANADGGFADVEKTDWFYGVAGSAKKEGIINGYEDNTFRGRTVIPKVQIVSVAARVLKNEMNYKDVSYAEYLLERNYIDADLIAQWAVNDVALATDANMVVQRNDYKFAGTEEMTRGDAAVILKRLFDKIW